MDDYSKILEKEKKLLNKENLLDDTIVEDKLSKHEIISKMYKGLVSEIEELKSILFKNLKKTNLDIPPPDPEMNQSEIENMINNDE